MYYYRKAQRRSRGTGRWPWALPPSLSLTGGETGPDRMIDRITTTIIRSHSAGGGAAAHGRNLTHIQQGKKLIPASFDRLQMIMILKHAHSPPFPPSLSSDYTWVSSLVATPIPEVLDWSRKIASPSSQQGSTHGLLTLPEAGKATGSLFSLSLATSRHGWSMLLAR